MLDLQQNKPALLFKGNLLIQRFEGKGGWHFVEIPIQLPASSLPFGWLTVTVEVNNQSLGTLKLMPMGNGHLFLPLNAQLRKKMNLELGQHIHVALFSTVLNAEQIQTFFTCLNDDPQLKARFFQLSEHKQRFYLERVSLSKNENELELCILRLMNHLRKN